MSHPAGPTAPHRRRRPANRQGVAGWLFVSPVLVILGLFLFIPILMALWVSVSDWSGNGSPFDPSVGFVGAENYRAVLRGKGFFRTAFYFPSVTSSVAITTLWLFLFNASGSVNKALGWLGVHGPNWFADPRGVLGLLLEPLGVHETGALARPGFLGVSAYKWLQGPSRWRCACSS
ncbi:hypothetical protein GCM10027030_10960 [Luteococcus sediminum]